MFLDLSQSRGDIQVSRQRGVAEAVAESGGLHEGGFDRRLAQLVGQPGVGLRLRSDRHGHGIIRHHGDVDAAGQRLLGLLGEFKIRLGRGLE